MARRLSELELPKRGNLSAAQALAVVVRERRLTLGLSQEDLEDDQLTQSHVSKIERGQLELGIGRFIVLAGKLDWTPSELIEQVTRRMNRAK